jgi:hypothetical protein
MFAGMIRVAALIAVATIGLAGEALAAGACRPTLDGKDRIERSGACPSGYYVRGACCESFQASSQRAMPTLGKKTCPAGTVASLGTCVAAK